MASLQWASGIGREATRARSLAAIRDIPPILRCRTKVAVIADRKSHIAPPLRPITGAEIERGIGPLRADGRVQILMVGTVSALK